MATIYCGWCKAGYASLGERPPVCPSCNAPADWVPDVDGWPVKLTANDKKFLKSIRIGAA